MEVIRVWADRVKALAMLCKRCLSQFGTETAWRAPGQVSLQITVLKLLIRWHLTFNGHSGFANGGLLQTLQLNQSLRIASAQILNLEVASWRTTARLTNADSCTALNGCQARNSTLDIL